MEFTTENTNNGELLTITLISKIGAEDYRAQESIPVLQADADEIRRAKARLISRFNERNGKSVVGKPLPGDAPHA
ncbi:hypothetical protein [Acerihabitans arboris]|uniref:Uncharacterized protein n=1 Tax=Acerihabitans arboris TaxID=2691583 RepID=A0A845SHU9_9GAMM|nr:hypothetical protein [Acerihabitans arboris]NDL62524.1 hypothetical protein [Acerihabitans arboris]